MKKYWKSVVVLAFIVIGLSTYLIQSSLASSDLPRIQIEHVSGDESLVEGIGLSGSYIVDNRYNTFNFDGEDTNYGSERSFTEEIIGRRSTLEDELINEYRNFMRGQPYLYDNFYNSDDALVIVDSEWDYFNGQSRAELRVSFLNKDTEEEQHKVINLENTHYANVLEVQYIDGRIYLYVEFVQQNDRRKVREFVYDVESKVMVSDQEVFESDEPGENRYVEVRKLRESIMHEPADSMVLRATEVLLEEGEDGLRETEREEKLYKYDIQNGEMTQLDLPAEEYGSAQRFDGQLIYFMQPSEESLNIIPYDIESEEFMDGIKMPQSEPEIESGLEHQTSPFFDVKDQRVYMLDGNAIHVIDATTGETVYEGKIVVDEDVDFENIRIDDLRFQ
ncbi:hypothetical protein ACTWQB_10335 [Piscibacillus sp. B03]|uniref:hypothetical protein n=1 Tax=Piscibacillus sp. B03 TaxID=3457430 RepID=UPI003FCE84C6